MAAPGERVFTPEELIVYNGTDLSKPLYICLRGVVFDVSASREFYGPGGPYEVFAGRECARALALMKLDESECNANLEGLEEKHHKTLQQWHDKFASKYTIVGKMTLTGGAAASEVLPAPGLPPVPLSLAVYVGLFVLLLLFGVYLLLNSPGPHPDKQEL